MHEKIVNSNFGTITVNAKPLGTKISVIIKTRKRKN